MSESNKNTNTNAIDDFEDFLEGNYVSIKEGQPPRELEFVRQSVTSPDDGSITWKWKTDVVEKPGFKGNGKTLKAQYRVINPKSQSRREKIFELTRRQAATIKTGLEPDKSIYKVWKTGTGMDTQYHIEAIR